jgi:hypothetical protein
MSTSRLILASLDDPRSGTINYPAGQTYGLVSMEGIKNFRLKTYPQ